MTTLIIEDEKPAARLLQRKVEKLGVQVQTMLHSVEEAVEWFSTERTSGFDFFRHSVI